MIHFVTTVKAQESVIDMTIMNTTEYGTNTKVPEVHRQRVLPGVPHESTRLLYEPWRPKRRQPGEWNSNTRGQGIAVVPRDSDRRRRNRIIESPSVHSFDKRLTKIERLSRRVKMIVESPGGVLISLSTIVLSLGLSPLMIGDAPEPAPADNGTSVHRSVDPQ